jgi:hypothetical protein
MADEREEKEAKVRRWRQAADECRAMAADTKDPQGRQNLLDLARAYDEAADRVQESLERIPNGRNRKGIPAGEGM